MNKLQIKLLFIGKQYEDLRKLITRTPEKLPIPFNISKSFNKKEIKILINYGIKEKYSYLLSKLIPFANHDDILKIAEISIKGWSYYNIRLELLPYLNIGEGKQIVKSMVDKSETKWMIDNRSFKHIETYVNYVIEEENSILLLKVAKILSNIPKYDYKEDVTRKIKEYFKNEKDIKNIIELVKIPEYNDEYFEDFILSHDFSEFKEYIKYANNKMLSIIYMFQKATDKEIEEYINENQKDTLLIKDILNYLISLLKKEDSKRYVVYYLKMIYKYNKDFKEEIFDLLSTYGTGNDLKPILTSLEEKEQNYICEIDIRNNDYNSMYKHAISTDCVNTYRLLDLLLDTKEYNIDVDITNNISGRFNSYVWDYLFKNRDINYIKNILNQLYIVNIEAFLNGITYIVLYKKEELFSESEKMFIKEIYQDKQDILLELKK